MCFQSKECRPDFRFGNVRQPFRVDGFTSYGCLNSPGKSMARTAPGVDGFREIRRIELDAYPGMRTGNCSMPRTKLE